jgi:Bacterial regulatory proteins, tetR family
MERRTAVIGSAGLHHGWDPAVARCGPAGAEAGVCRETRRPNRSRRRPPRPPSAIIDRWRLRLALGPGVVRRQCDPWSWRQRRELFDQRGYERVSTREIAERAGVTQAAVFRHFGTKGDLYIEAVCQPFYGFVTGYLRRWIDGGHGSGTSLRHTEVFVDGLCHLLLDNRPLPAALAGQVGDAQERVQSEFLQDVLDRVERGVTSRPASEATRRWTPPTLCASPSPSCTE